MTGTDLYRDIHHSKQARESLRLADRLILLQEAGLDELPLSMRQKACIIYQSASPTGTKPAKLPRNFRVIVLGHLRHEKDPLRAAMAVRHLPASSRILVEHFGAARDERLAERAAKEMRANARYRWLGELPRWQARRRLARSRLLLLSSRMEGGANVLSEALADNVPVIASRIPGSVGILGKDYAGFFPVSDTLALRRLLLRTETDPVFFNQLAEQCQKRSFLVEPDRESEAWRPASARFVTAVTRKLGTP